MKMNEQNRLEDIDGLAIFRPAGSCRFQQVVNMVTLAITEAKDRGFRKILINTYGISGFEPPSISERHCMVRDWVTASAGKLKVAMVVPPEFIDPEKFGIVAAANFGVIANVFSSEPEALEWIRSDI